MSSLDSYTTTLILGGEYAAAGIHRTGRHARVEFSATGVSPDQDRVAAGRLPVSGTRGGNKQNSGLISPAVGAYPALKVVFVGVSMQLRTFENVEHDLQVALCGSSFAAVHFFTNPFAAQCPNVQVGKVFFVSRNIDTHPLADLRQPLVLQAQCVL